MKKFILCIFIFVLSNLCYAQVDNVKIDSGPEVYTGEFTYQIGPGDTIQIKVWRHPDLDMEVRVRPDCKIAFPLVNEIDVRNVTTETFKKELTDKLSRIIRDPEVTVNVVGFESKKIFVLGEVNQPGVYPFEGQERVLDALSKAMGYKEETAALKSIIIIKRGGAPRPRAVRVNILDLIKKGDIKQDVLLEPGDIIFVPRTFISNINKFIDQFFSKTDPVLKYYLDIYNIRNPGVLQ
jgi:polysaccharide export outer membrane protein